MIRLLEDVAIEEIELLKFSGEIDFRSTPGFRAMLQAKVKAECPRLLLDMSQVSYVSSSGMGALLEYQRDAKEYGGMMAIFGLNERLDEIFRMVHLDTHLWIFPACEEAEAFLHGV